MTQIIDGKTRALCIREDIAKQVNILKSRKVTPSLAVILVGNNPASHIYVKNKRIACKKAGIECNIHHLDESTNENTLTSLIDQLNNDESIHGILVQLPLPAHINTPIATMKISPQKDVDGFHPINIGHLNLGTPLFSPCTPMGIIDLIKSTGELISGKHAVIIGRSNIVGKPILQLLLQHHATVTICHSHTQNIEIIAKQADILIAAVGIAHFVKSHWIKKNAILIDVGINRCNDNTLVGDIDYDNVFGIASYITPVPGGVGPMTIAMLLQNTLLAAKNMHP